MPCWYKTDNQKDIGWPFGTLSWVFLISLILKQQSDETHYWTIHCKPSIQCEICTAMQAIQPEYLRDLVPCVKQGCQTSYFFMSQG